jgi:WhiB family redox-sensing transcriptional regulator
VSWQDRAACAGTPMLLFFGPDGETRAEQVARESEAKAVCASCPVRADCLAYALGHPVRYGIWGGLNERERSVERRRRGRRASAA